MTSRLPLLLFMIAISFGSRASWSKGKTFQLLTPTGGDFRISSTMGEFDTLKVRGKILFLSFGFTHCPHICPHTLKNLKKMRERLTVAQQNKLVVLFVSVDPERDTIPHLQKFMKNFGDGFVGATDNDKNLNSIMKKFGARYARIKTRDGDIFIDHTSNVFVINEKGEWIDTLKYDSSTEEFIEAYQSIPKKTPQSLKLKRARMVTELGQSKDCDLGKSACAFKMPDGKVFKLQLLDSPIKTEKPLRVMLETNSKDYEPIEVDFEGINLNMGYIRPALQKSGNVFQGEFRLPICELKKMNWNVRLILKDVYGSQFSILYSLSTTD